MAETGSPWTFAGESPAVGSSDVVTLVDGTTFLVCDRSGDLPGHGARGLFMFDTRVLTRWELTVNGAPVQPLSVTPNGPFSATFVGRVDDPTLADAPLTVIQRRHVGKGMREDLEIRYHGAGPVALDIELRIGADFGSLFDVKAGHETPHEAVVVSPDPSTVKLCNPDGPGQPTVEATTITTATPPDRFDEGMLAWTVAMDPGHRWNNCLLVAVEIDGAPLAPSYQCGEPVEDAIPISRLRLWRNQVTSVETDNPILARAVNSAAEDLGALRIFDPEFPERVVVAAGAPWFMTLFGRDSLLASWMALPLDSDLAVGVLQELADAQGQVDDPQTEEQPGKILHEVRFDSASSRLLGGSNTYYGTVDATPLFVMLVAELARWTGLTDTVLDLMPSVDRAIEWTEQYGDADGDGLVEYMRRGSGGLENQGWKDSWDGIRHANGEIAQGPIALSEVQGYTYAALRGRAELARSLGEPETEARQYDLRADALKQRFDEKFWISERGWYATGLDGEKRHIGSLASNMGHLLWTGIVPRRIARHVAAHLVSPALNSGWGLRTLATNNPGYNPLSYHCGSVWPHDTALAVAGLARYHCDDAAQQLAEGLLAASAWTNGRLPELFAGFSTTDVSSPVPYPASCSPQAWAAASPLLLLRAFLGLEPNLLAGRIRLRPRLPEGLGSIHLSGISFGEHKMDITVDSSGTRVEGLPPTISIEIDGRA